MTTKATHATVDTIVRSESNRHLIDVTTLAEQLGVTHRFIRRLIAEDRVPFLKIGKFVRFDPAQIDQWLADCRRGEWAILG